jgi:hypothetical protein
MPNVESGGGGYQRGWGGRRHGAGVSMKFAPGLPKRTKSLNRCVFRSTSALT